MPDFSHADGGTSWLNVRLQISSNKSWKMASFQISAGMLSRPGDFYLCLLDTVWSSFKLKGSVLILSVSSIALLFFFGCRGPSLWILKVVKPAAFLCVAESPFTRMDGLLLCPVRSLIASQAVACCLFVCWRDIRSILSWMYSAWALA